MEMRLVRTVCGNDLSDIQKLCNALRDQYGTIHEKERGQVGHRSFKGRSWHGSYKGEAKDTAAATWRAVWGWYITREWWWIWWASVDRRRGFGMVLRWWCLDQGWGRGLPRWWDRGEDSWGERGVLVLGTRHQRPDLQLWRPQHDLWCSGCWTHGFLCPRTD